jgi:hypothetical protein
MKKEFDLSEKIVVGGCIEDCACNSGDKDYHPELDKQEIHFFLNVKYVKEFIRLLEDNSEEINGKSYIKISTMQKFAGRKFK